MPTDERPPQAVVMQMMMGAWIAQTIAAVTRLDVPDLLHEHGPLTAVFVDVRPGDTYVLKALVHDWDDERAIRVLRHCRRHLPPDGRMLCVDSVLPPLGDTGCSGTKLLDG